MMQYEVTYSCGHTGTIQLYGSASKRERKLRWYQTSAVCPDCYKSAKTVKASKDCDEVRMSYREYKLNHSDCHTKSGSYDSISKTIIVYVPHKAGGVVADLLSKGFTMEQIKQQASISKSQIFRQAHQIAKAVTAQYPDTDYRVNFALALREAYCIIKAVKAAA